MNKAKFSLRDGRKQYGTIYDNIIVAHITFQLNDKNAIRTEWQTFNRNKIISLGLPD